MCTRTQLQVFFITPILKLFINTILRYLQKNKNAFSLVFCYKGEMHVDVFKNHVLYLKIVFFIMNLKRFCEAQSKKLHALYNPTLQFLNIKSKVLFYASIYFLNHNFFASNIPYSYNFLLLGL